MDFYYQYRNYFFDEMDEIEEAAGRKPVNRKSSESATALNTAIIAYFTRHPPSDSPVLGRSRLHRAVLGRTFDSGSHELADGLQQHLSQVCGQHRAQESGPGDVVSAVKNFAYWDY